MCDDTAMAVAKAMVDAVEAQFRTILPMVGLRGPIGRTEMDDRTGEPTVALEVGGFLVYPTRRPDSAPGAPPDVWAIDASVVTHATREEPGDADFVEVDVVRSESLVATVATLLFQHRLDGALEYEAQHGAVGAPRARKGEGDGDQYTVSLMTVGQIGGWLEVGPSSHLGDVTFREAVHVERNADYTYIRNVDGELMVRFVGHASDEAVAAYVAGLNQAAKATEPPAVLRVPNPRGVADRVVDTSIVELSATIGRLADALGVPRHAPPGTPPLGERLLAAVQDQQRERDEFEAACATMRSALEEHALVRLRVCGRTNTVDAAIARHCERALASDAGRALLERLRAAEAALVCDVCVGRPLAPEGPCICGGTGRVDEAFRRLRAKYFTAADPPALVLEGYVSEGYLWLVYGGDPDDGSCWVVAPDAEAAARLGVVSLFDGETPDCGVGVMNLRTVIGQTVEIIDGARGTLRAGRGDAGDAE